MALGAVKAFRKATISSESSTDISLITAEAVGYPRALMLDGTGKAILFNPITAQQNGFVGVSLFSQVLGAIVTVRPSGLLQYSGWGLSLGPVYAGASGVISNTPPSAGIVAEIGFAYTTDSIVINPKLQIAY